MMTPHLIQLGLFGRFVVVLERKQLLLLHVVWSAEAIPSILRAYLSLHFIAAVRSCPHTLAPESLLEHM